MTILRPADKHLLQVKYHPGRGDFESSFCIIVVVGRFVYGSFPISTPLVSRIVSIMDIIGELLVKHTDLTGKIPHSQFARYPYTVHASRLG